MTPLPSLTRTTSFPLSIAALSTLVGLVLVSALCIICKRKRRKKKTLCSDGVMMVDVTLLRQTQLRSLSKSDTKLHELQSIRFKETNRRPLSMDYHYPSPLDRSGGQQGLSNHIPQKRVLPKIPHAGLRGDWRSPNRIYSNLKPNPDLKPQESVAGNSEAVTASTDANPEPPPSASRCDENTAAITAEYACVKKLRKCIPGELPDQGQHKGPETTLKDISSLVRDPQTPPPKGLIVKLEEMYSTVCKHGKNKSLNPASPVPENAILERDAHIAKVETHAAIPHQQPGKERAGPSSTVQLEHEEPAYETIDLPWAKKGKEDNTERKCHTENLYESISEAKEAHVPGRTRTLKSLNGLEVYLTGL
ncbi:lck-interacting transmembrane adapter 1 [Pleurodeles waltl]|uniref:lck-interacting transmembrane adapter 1 n=1 Tax=Pleurodeles waltl TaxID=8319 RepID=UPI003709C596